MSKTDQTFNTGDTVYLKSGSHPMTYAESDEREKNPEYDFVRVAWGDYSSGIDDTHISPRCLTATPTLLPLRAASAESARLKADVLQLSEVLDEFRSLVGISQTTNIQEVLDEVQQNIRVQASQRVTIKKLGERADMLEQSLDAVREASGHSHGYGMGSVISDIKKMREDLEGTA